MREHFNRTSRLYFFALIVPMLSVLIACQAAHKRPLISDETLVVAKRSNFDYAHKLSLAEYRDRNAAHDLLKFSLEMDAAAAIGHGVVLARLASVWGDKDFADLVSSECMDVKSAVRRELEAGLFAGPGAPNKPLRQCYPATYAELLKQKH